VTTAPALVVVGMSWGGLQAFSALLRRLPADYPVPVAVVQHRSRESTSLLALVLQDAAALPVHEVEDHDPIVPGVHLAPADYHLLVGDGLFNLSVDPPVRFSRPSIDVTFTSAAESYGARVAGVVLTGANDDGARGLACSAEHGGLALVQDPATAEVPTMPQAALRRVPTAEVHTLDGLADRLLAIAGVAARAEAGPR